MWRIILVSASSCVDSRSWMLGTVLLLEQLTWTFLETRHQCGSWSHEWTFLFQITPIIGQIHQKLKFVLIAWKEISWVWSIILDPHFIQLLNSTSKAFQPGCIFHTWCPVSVTAKVNGACTMWNTIQNLVFQSDCIICKAFIFLEWGSMNKTHWINDNWCTIICGW